MEKVRNLGAALSFLLKYSKYFPGPATELLKASREFTCSLQYLTHIQVWDHLREYFEGKKVSEVLSKLEPTGTRIALDVLRDAGAVRISKGVIRLRKPGEPPELTTELARDVIEGAAKPAFKTLPEALVTRKRPLVYLGEDKKIKRIFAKFLDNAGYNAFRVWCIRTAGLDKLPSNSMVVDLGCGLGLSTRALLELTYSNVVAIDPYPDAELGVRLQAKLVGAEDRVTFVGGRGEELTKLLREREIGPVDAVLMVNVLHWAVSPARVLAEVAKALRAGGIAALVQSVYDASPTARASNMFSWLLGSGRHPTYGELEAWIASTGLVVEKHVKFPLDLYVLRKI